MSETPRVPDLHYEFTVDVTHLDPMPKAIAYFVDGKRVPRWRWLAIARKHDLCIPESLRKRATDG